MNKNDKKKVLIVDDEEAKRTAVGQALQDEGFATEEADNGKIGLEKALKSHPDLILLDIRMPVMGGLDMLKELRKDEWGKEVTVVLFSSYADPDQISQALALGAQDYLLKSSYDLDEVVQQLKSKLGA